MQPARPIIENLLTKGKLEAAIEGSLILCRHYADQERGGSAAQLSARFHALMTDFHAGTVDDDDYRPERARINRAMFELTEAFPANWTDEALKQVNFSPDDFDNSARETGEKRPGQPWGLILGIAGLLVMLGVALRVFVFAPKDPVPVQTEIQKSTPDTMLSHETKPTQEIKPLLKEVPPKTTVKTPSKETKPDLSQPTTIRKDAPATSAPNVEAPNERFRSFANTRISDGMELGYMGSKLAFRDLRTKDILCCFTDAKSFAGGRAYVSKDGVNYYFINKKGDKVE